MRGANFLKRSLKILAWGAGGVAVVALAWLAANRLLDERPDPRREAFLKSAEIPEAQNIAVGVLGLGAPRGTDFMKHGAELDRMIREHAPRSEIEAKAHGPGELKLTVQSGTITCWVDPDWPVQPDGCLPFDQAPEVLAENRELLGRFKALYRLGRHSGAGIDGRIVVDLTKLAVAEMRLDMRRGDPDAAYAKWRGQFRFARNYLRGQDDWVGKAIGLVDLGLGFSVIEDLLVAKPALVRAHRGELLELLRPEGVETINPAGIARAQYLQMERFFEDPGPGRARYEDWIDRWARALGQPNRMRNWYLSYSIDYADALRRPWPQLPEAFERMKEKYYAVGWDQVIDPFGSLIMIRNVQWQLKTNEMLRHAYLLDGRLRLATLAVRIVDERIRDRDIPAFLAGAAPGLSHPFTGEPMQWDPRNGRLYFPMNIDNDPCAIGVFRVPVWDATSARRPPKAAEWSRC